MALFMDAHTIDGPVSIDDVAKAHAADLQTQDDYGVHYLRYWVDQEHGKIFCLVDAPDADAAATVHREAHGLVADEIYPVAEGAGHRGTTDHAPGPVQPAGARCVRNQPVSPMAYTRVRPLMLSVEAMNTSRSATASGAPR